MIIEPAIFVFRVKYPSNKKSKNPNMIADGSKPHEGIWTTVNIPAIRIRPYLLPRYDMALGCINPLKKNSSEKPTNAQNMQ